ncbi:MAG: hypothetical protein N3F63_04355 [Thermoplasmata archaeon]|nr:hypothetical protein [Thermoplasmata archaeon]
MTEAESTEENEKQGEKKARREKKYALPSRDTIVEAAVNLYLSGRTVDSQEKLRKLILGKLQRDNNLYRLSGKRLRKVLIKAGIAKVQIVARESEGKRPYFLCPVCDARLTKIVNQTLNGTEVVIGYKCPTCGYWTHRKKRVPVRYIFTLSKT